MSSATLEHRGFFPALLQCLVSPEQFDFWARQLGSIAAWERCYARVSGVQQDQRGGLLLQLKANRHAARVLDGRFCRVRVEIAGRKRLGRVQWHQVDGGLVITVRRTADDPVSNYLRERVGDGSVIELLADYEPSESVAASAETVQVKLRRSDKTLVLSRSTSLLEALEHAGVKPDYGCRRGICNRCSCTRLQGQTVDMQSGDVGADAGAVVRLCVQRAASDLELDL